MVQGGLGPVDYVSQWLSHQRGDGYCNEALDFSLVRTEQDSSLGLRFFCQNLGHLGHRTSRLILLLEMMAWSSLHLVTNCIPLVNRDRATSGSAECLRERLPVLITPRVVWKPTCYWGISGVVWQTWAGSPQLSSSRPGPACLGRRAGPGTPTHIPSRPECLVFESDIKRKKIPPVARIQ